MSEDNQDEVFVSIVVPVYNVEQYLPDCLDSLLLHQGSNLEVIAVNDCSTDNSLHVLRGYQCKTSLLKVLELENNQGVSAARNAGVAAANGRYVLFVDADDTLESGAVDVLHHIVEEREVDIIKFGHRCVSEDGRIVRSSVKTSVGVLRCYDLMDDSDRGRALHAFVGSLMAWNGLYKRELISAVPFMKYSNGEDVLFGVQAFCHAGIVCTLQNCLYNYLHRSGSASKVKTYSHCKSSIDVCYEIFDTLRVWKYYSRAKNVIFRKLRAMSHGLILNIIDDVPEADKEKCWMDWFDTFESIYCVSDLLCPVRRGFYKIIFHSRSPLVVHCVYKVPMQFKAKLFSKRNFLKIWMKYRELGLR